MNACPLTRSLILALIAALALVGMIHIFACEQMMCDPGLTVRAHAATLLDICGLPICAFLAINASALSLFLARWPGRLAESIPILSTASLPHFVPPPRSA